MKAGDEDRKRIAIRLPTNVSRPARGTYFAACLLADQTGEVPDGQRALRETMGYGESQMREVCKELEAYSLIRRGRGMQGNRVFVIVLQRKSGADLEGCETCGRLPLARINGAKHCATCYQIHGRPDRRWKAVAMEVWARGVQQGASDMRIAYSIHMATKQPLWGDGEEGRRGGGGSTLAQGAAVEGVIPWMVSAGLADPELMRIVRRVRRGEEDGV